MDEISCPNCQARLPTHAAFCDNCGVNLSTASSAVDSPAGQPGGAPLAETDRATVTTCPTCQNRVRPGAKFCDNCGSSLANLPDSATPRLRDVAPTVLESSPRPSDRTIAEPLAAAAASAPTPDRTMLEPRPRSPYAYGHLVVIATGARIEFPQGRTVINVGREDPVGNVFPEVDLAPHGGEGGGVSRRHARFSLQDGELVVEDLNSANFTFVNNQRVMPGARQPVRHGDEVRFGRVKTRYESA